MKNVKKYVMGLVAMTIAATSITLMSMGLGKEETVNTPQWFVFNGNPNDVNQIENPDYYSPFLPTMTESEPSCKDGTNLCALKALPSSSDTSKPDEESLLEVLDRNQGSSPDREEIKHKI